MDRWPGHGALARAGFAAALMAVCLGAPDMARGEFAAIRLAQVSGAPEQPGLAEFLARLRDFAARRDLAGVTALAAEDFRWERDLGGGYDPKAGAAANLTTALELDDAKLSPEYRGAGWKRLEAILAARSWGGGGEPAEICAPAEPRYASPNDQARAYAEDDLIFGFGYVDAEGVRVRAAPSLDAEPRDSVSWEAVRVLDWNDQDDWVEVETARGARGFAAAAYVLSFVAERLCFGQVGQGWRITAYIGRGD